MLATLVNKATAAMTAPMRHLPVKPGRIEPVEIGCKCNFIVFESTKTSTQLFLKQP
jgi:hypothetical protein